MVQRSVQHVILFHSEGKVSSFSVQKERAEVLNLCFCGQGQPLLTRREVKVKFFVVVVAFSLVHQWLTRSHEL